MNILRKILSISTFLSLGLHFTYGQINSAQYPVFLKRADSLYKVKDYYGSAQAYEKAFKSIGGKGITHYRYSAARSWARANNADSAFLQLFHIVEKNFFKDDDEVVNDEDFESLHMDYRWEKLLNLMKQNNDYNFGFERENDFGTLPKPWFQWGDKDYSIKADSTQKHLGKYSILIEAPQDSKPKSFGCAALAIPANYEGKQIEVQTYMKIKNTAHPIGLMLRIDSKIPGETLAFNNMEQDGVQGNADWTLYSVKLPLPEEAAMIYIGAILHGYGKIWADDFKVLIDGRDIAYALPKYISNANDSTIKPKITQLNEILSSTNFIIDVEDDKGIGKYTFSKPEDTWKMGYRYRQKNTDKPFKLIDEARIAKDDFDRLRKALFMRVRTYMTASMSFYTHYTIRNNAGKVDFYSKYFDIWTLLRSNFKK